MTPKLGHSRMDRSKSTPEAVAPTYIYAGPRFAAACNFPKERM
jgi:hypothetical protein